MVPTSNKAEKVGSELYCHTCGVPRPCLVRVYSTFVRSSCSRLLTNIDDTLSNFLSVHPYLHHTRRGNGTDSIPQDVQSGYGYI